jgi:hypothetical protein
VAARTVTQDRAALCEHLGGRQSRSGARFDGCGGPSQGPPQQFLKAIPTVRSASNQSCRLSRGGTYIFRYFRWGDSTSQRRETETARPYRHNASLVPAREVPPALLAASDCFECLLDQSRLDKDSAANGKSGASIADSICAAKTQSR